MRIAGLVALAVIESINPSAIVITLYLLTRPRATAQGTDTTKVSA